MPSREKFVCCIEQKGRFEPGPEECSIQRGKEENVDLEEEFLFVILRKMAVLFTAVLSYNSKKDCRWTSSDFAERFFTYSTVDGNFVYSVLCRPPSKGVVKKFVQKKALHPCLQTWQVYRAHSALLCCRASDANSFSRQWRLLYQSVCLLWLRRH